MGSSERFASSRLQTLARLTDPVAHDARGALSAMALHQALLVKALGKNEPDTAERQRRWLEIMDAERERLRRLLEPLFAQLVAATEPGPSDASSLVDTALALVRPYAARRRVELTGPAVPRPLRTGCRREVVLQVLSDLLLLAVDATAAGSAVAVTLEPHAGATRVVVASPSVSAADAEHASRAALASWTDLGPDGSALHVAAPNDAGLVVTLTVPPPPAGDACDA